MMNQLRLVFRITFGAVACLLSFCPVFSSLAEAQLLPPEQDYYLHVYQRVNFCCGAVDDAKNGIDQWAFGARHEFAWVETPGDLIVSDALTVETWVLWEGSDFEEVQAASGVDMDKMTLFCGQRAYGFQRRSFGAEGWTFFLQTDTATYPDTGVIPLPLGEWAHLAATYDGSMIRTFLNGVQQTQTAASGAIPELGDAFGEHCTTDRPEAVETLSEGFGIGLGKGVTGGFRQVRIWNRALSEEVILSQASLHLDGTESGLVGYWPLDGPPDPAQAPSKLSGGSPLLFGTEDFSERATWRLTQPMFVIREDLAEDAFVTDCATLSTTSTLVENFVILASGAGTCGSGFARFAALIREGESGFIFNTAGAIAGTPPIALGAGRSAVGDFNNDSRLDIFISQSGEDFCADAGATNTLMLARPDGRLEDASDRLLGAPCDADTPQFEGQHLCYMGGDFGGRTPGIRYPGSGDPVPIGRDPTTGTAAGDIDGDGDLDIVVCNYPAMGLEAPYILINDGQGGFEANWQMLPDYLYGPVPLDPEEIGLDTASVLDYLLEDMDGDGHIDLVTSPALLPRTMEWVGGISWNDGTGDFSAADRMVITPTEGIPNDIRFNPPFETPFSEGGMVAADIDNDGDKDLLVSWNPANLYVTDFSSSLQILVNKGRRVFNDETELRVGSPPQIGMPRSWVGKFYVEDMNNDGCPDLLFPDDNIRQLDAAIWLNNCHGYFSPIPEPVLPRPDAAYHPLDFDGDGDIDLLSFVTRPVNFAGTDGCGEGEGEGTDYIDIAVLLNVNPTKYKSQLISKGGFEEFISPVPEPSVSTSSPLSPANDNNPKIIGSAQSGAIVNLYSDKTCTDLLATGTANEFSTTGIMINVIDNSATTIYATATDGLGTVSPCSNSFISYIETGCDIGGGIWATEARDCTTEDCSDGRWHSWDGRSWCRALITQEGENWNVAVPPGASTFDFWADWGAWDLNECGDGVTSINIPVCGLNETIHREGEEQHLTCDVTGLSSFVIEKEIVACEYVIIGNPHFY